MILILLGSLTFVFPLAVYCLILATLNRQKHPVMVPGPWDFSQVVFACSGFLVFGGPAALSNFSDRWRVYWFTGSKAAFPTMGHEWWYFWFGVWACYFVAVIGVVVFMLYRRRRLTAIYNIRPAALHDTLGLVLDRLGFDWKRDRQHYFIGPRAVAAVAEPAAAPGDAITTRPTRPAGPEIVLNIDAFSGLRHATLIWPEDAGPARQEIEDELASALVDVDTGDNAVGFWFLTIGVTTFVLIFFAIVFVLTLFYLLTQRQF